MYEHNTILTEEKFCNDPTCPLTREGVQHTYHRDSINPKSGKHQVPFIIIFVIAIFSIVFAPLIILGGILRIDITGENKWWVWLIIYGGLFGIVLPGIAKLAKRWGIK